MDEVTLTMLRMAVSAQRATFVKAHRQLAYDLYVKDGKVSGVTVTDAEIETSKLYVQLHNDTLAQMEARLDQAVQASKSEWWRKEVGN